MVARATLRTPKEKGGAYFAAPAADVSFISSGCKMFDLSLGGGWARGRIANIVGDTSTGKTLLAIEVCACFAMTCRDGLIYYRECESAFDRGYAAALGMPVDRVDFGRPLETVDDLFEDLLLVIAKAKKEKKRRPILYIVDSLDALSDRSEKDAPTVGAAFAANKARKMSELFRRLVRQMSEVDLSLIIISQVRDRIGVTWGRKTSRNGGRALDFYASQIVYLRHFTTLVRTIDGIKRPTGIRVISKCSKNKVGMPFRESQFDIRFGFGIDDMSACIEWLKSIKWKADDYRLPADTAAYVRGMEKNGNGDFNRMLEYLHKVSAEQWYALEAKFLPARRKYDVH